MTPLTPTQMAALAKELVDASAQKNIPLRVLGGVAVFMTCSSIETHPKLQRVPHDLDLIAPLKDFTAVAELLTARGIVSKTKEATRWVFDKEGMVVELNDLVFRSPQRIDFSARLSVASPTLPMADLLLLKLQRSPFDEKHIQDAIALLLDHRVAQDEVPDQIDHAYIAKLCAQDWGLHTAVYDNSVTLEQVLEKYVEPEEAQLLWRRIELIQEDMDQQKKSLGWMVQQILRRPTQVPS